jgi:hypothetical protein
MSDTLMGPAYSYADELATPSELGITQDGSAGGILRAVAGVNYYTDAIGFGESTMLAKAQGWSQKPLGLRYFTDTGLTCSNGAKMFEYIDTTPPGLPGRVGAEIKKTLQVDLKGLGPGIMADAVGALNPLPMFKAIVGSAYAACKKVTLPVGDLNGNLKSPHPGGAAWITEGDTQVGPGGPTQTRWVYDHDVSQEEYDNTEKTEVVEGFQSIRARYERAKRPRSALAIGAGLCLILGGYYLARRG